MLLYTMLYIVLAYLMLFAALTNSVCLNNASFFFLFKYFLCQGYKLSGEITLKNNNYYYYYYDVTSRLHQMANFAPRAISRILKSTNITAHLILINWLPIKVQGTYNAALFVFHCHSIIAPSFVTDMPHKKTAAIFQHSLQLTHNDSCLF